MGDAMIWTPTIWTRRVRVVLGVMVAIVVIAGGP